MHGGVAEASPEFLGGSGERGASGNYGPEFPAEAAVNRAEAPPAAEEMFAFGRFEIALEFFELAAGGEIALDLILERFDEARDGDEHGDTLVVNRADYFRGVERIEEHGCAAENLGEENSEKLAEDVAERKEVEKAQGMKEAFPAAVAVDFFFEGFEVGEQVAVGDDDAAGFGGGAGGEDDFYGIGALNRRGGKFRRRFLCVGGMQGFEFDDGDAEIGRGSGGEFTADCGCAHTGLACDAGWQISGRRWRPSGRLLRLRTGSREMRRAIRRNFRPRLGCGRLLRCLARGEVFRELMGGLQEFGVGPADGAVASAPGDCDFAGWARIGSGNIRGGIGGAWRV